jgi:hypothetical protein
MTAPPMPSFVRPPLGCRSAMPVRITPQLVRPTPTRAAGEARVNEIKHDGHRIHRLSRAPPRPLEVARCSRATPAIAARPENDG